jgi:hypothetical protein
MKKETPEINKLLVGSHMCSAILATCDSKHLTATIDAAKIENLSANASETKDKYPLRYAWSKDLGPCILDERVKDHGILDTDRDYPHEDCHRAVEEGKRAFVATIPYTGQKLFRTHTTNRYRFAVGQILNRDDGLVGIGLVRFASDWKTAHNLMEKCADSKRHQKRTDTRWTYIISVTDVTKTVEKEIEDHYDHLQELADAQKEASPEKLIVDYTPFLPIAAKIASTPKEDTPIVEKTPSSTPIKETSD